MQQICADTRLVCLHFPPESSISEAFVIHWKLKYLKTFSFLVKIRVSEENFGAALLKDGSDYRKELQQCCLADIIDQQIFTISPTQGTGNTANTTHKPN